ncbi:unnamed protein product, partial [Pylaiella littoralis]
MRGQCGIAVVAVTLVTTTGKGITPPAATTPDAPVTAPLPLGSIPAPFSTGDNSRRKCTNRASLLEAAIAGSSSSSRGSAHPIDERDGTPQQLRLPTKSWGASQRRQPQEASSCAHASTGDCSQPPFSPSSSSSSSSSSTQRRRREQVAGGGLTRPSATAASRSSNDKGNNNAKKAAAAVAGIRTLHVRGGGRTSWFGRSNDKYDEFPPDFDYDEPTATNSEGDDSSSSSTEDSSSSSSTAAPFYWPEDDDCDDGCGGSVGEEPVGNSAAATAGAAQPSSDGREGSLGLKNLLEEEDDDAA